VDKVQRVDKWLWMARFYKTRGVASDAIKGGHVRINDIRCKPARQIQVGDTLTIRKENIQWQIEVLALAARRGPAKEAQTLYLESEQSVQQRLQARENRSLASPSPGKRPDKRARGKIIRFTNRHNLV